LTLRSRLPSRRTLGRLLGLGLAAVIGLLLLRQLAADWSNLSDQTLRDALHFDPRPLAAAWVAQTAGWLLLVGVWRRMLGDAADLPMRQHLRVYAYSSLAHVLPGTIWSPASRVAMYRGLGVPGLAVTAALLVEWLLVGLGGLLLYVVAAPWSRSGSPQGMAVLAGVAIAALILLHPRAHGRLLRFAARWLGGSYDARQAPALRQLATWFVLDLTVLALSGLSLYLLMLAISPAASLPDAMAAWGLSMAIANLLVWLPATSLIKDAGVVLLLTPLYGSSVVALGVVIAWRVWMVIVQLSWAALAAALCGRVGRVGRAPRVAPDEGADTGV
jgi:uncharacterized membrane protein YbhN (UPF0104 family)